MGVVCTPARARAHDRSVTATHTWGEQRGRGELPRSLANGGARQLSWLVRCGPLGRQKGVRREKREKRGEEEEEEEEEGSRACFGFHTERERASCDDWRLLLLLRAELFLLLLLLLLLVFPLAIVCGVIALLFRTSFMVGIFGVVVVIRRSVLGHLLLLFLLLTREREEIIWRQPPITEILVMSGMPPQPCGTFGPFPTP